MIYIQCDIKQRGPRIYHVTQNGKHLKPMNWWSIQFSILYLGSIIDYNNKNPKLSPWKSRTVRIVLIIATKAFLYIRERVVFSPRLPSCELQDFICKYIFVYTHINICMCTYVYTYMYIYTYVCVYIYIYFCGYLLTFASLIYNYCIYAKQKRAQ